ncbi:MAG: hypothetical protein IPM66_21090 [Acidobacteriota bacterium]|nr:MAG: hypothetical protein IPM66_21090 [Acidobacteriota bacterium]
MKILFSLLLLSATSICGFAQDHPKAELFGGYSALVVESRELTVDTVNQTFVRRETGFLNGWNASLAYSPLRWLGFVADFSGHYGDIDHKIMTPFQNATLGLNTDVHNFLFGPQFSARQDNYTAFARAMVGATVIDASATSLGESFSDGESGFAFGVGGGFDVRISDRISWRIIQADYIRARFSQPKVVINGETLSESIPINTVRISSGFVFRN